MISGGAAGLTCLAGITLLLHRRLAEPRIRATSKPMDIIILLWVFVTLLLGLISILFSAQHHGRQRHAAAGKLGATHRNLPFRCGGCSCWRCH